jgi:hypothetical protein
MPRSQRISVFGCFDTSIWKYIDMRSFKVKFNCFIWFSIKRSVVYPTSGYSPILSEPYWVFTWRSTCLLHGKVHASRYIWHQLSILLLQFSTVRARWHHKAPSWMNIWILIKFRGQVLWPRFQKATRKNDNNWDSKYAFSMKYATLYKMTLDLGVLWIVLSYKYFVQIKFGTRQLALMLLLPFLFHFTS